ncbi:tyramine oxidase [Frondihabitans sp. PAMC 28766]|uniref:primary-amine oxidase n=1 Tax=Frondihabitans sp. PAMC 28766 TaxID=1795630 RepID=UPI00078BFC24|nr:primary-amine oxidase [Frondihabitans sp. PAMC 28766]AMM20598.1 tyramine oxidase [Frondihabitans sp. PAMC 28766]
MSPHPLEPLSAAEIAQFSSILARDKALAPTARFVFVELLEPPKSVVTAWQPGEPFERHGSVVIREVAEHATYEGVVSLTDDRVVSYEVVPDVQPPISVEEFDKSEELVRADPRWQEAMRKRGVEDFDDAMVDKWSSGYTGPGDVATRRLARLLTFVKRGSGELAAYDNAYAHPVEGLIVTIDMDTWEVLEVTDHGVVPLPPTNGNYEFPLNSTLDAYPFVEKQREPMKPIEISQPKGSSVELDGHSLTWGPWHLQVGYTPREGVVLQDVRYLDRGRLRPILYRGSVAEMYVPYGDPAATHWNKNVFDEGEYGLGVLANSLELGCDCVGEILYLDAVVNDQDGHAVTIPNGICIHEEDAGIGWKHTEYRDGRGEVRRNRRLVISFFVTVGNYDYGFYWHLHLDGSIELEVKLTGIISTGALMPGAIAPGDEPGFGTLVAPQLYGPHHQHFFSVRLDMQVDGQRNNVDELNSAAVPAGPDNPWGSAWQVQRTRLTSEAEGAREASPQTARSWLVTSSDTVNGVGGRPGYLIDPGAAAPFFAMPGSQQRERGAFATKQLWVTKFAPRERYAAGDYIAQQPVDQGLSQYVKADRPLVDEDVVCWYTVGVHHIVRPEDWPVMPVARAGFHLKPVGFFDGNPMLDLPPEPMGDHCSHHGEDAAGAHEAHSH